MLVLIVEPQKRPYVQEIGENLTEMQRIVEGTIQCIYPFAEEIALICNDEGKLLHLPANRGLRDEDGSLYDIVCGTFFLCGAPADCDHFTGLNAQQLEFCQRRFQTPEQFINLNGQLFCLPIEEKEELK